VPYKGTGPAINSLLGNQIQLMFGAMPAAIPHVKANRLRALAVSTEKPSNALPGVPTIGETVKGYEVVLWYGVWGPKGLPKDIVNVWNRGIVQAVQTKEIQERMAGEGLEPAAGSPEQFRAAIKRDVEKWKRVVKQAKITIQS
jgi:tripartite-type tricarboxylate transporter receptor subunit TctC